MSDLIGNDIELLAELFKAGGWKELRVQFEGTSVLLSNDPSTPALDGRPPSGPPSSVAPNPTADAPTPEGVARVAAPLGAVDPSWIPVVAPNLGTFYRSPKPGAAPFVEVGQKVEADTEICLLEVMKLFTSVKAGVAGRVRRIDAGDAQLVEGGQILFHIQPD